MNECEVTRGPGEDVFLCFACPRELQKRMFLCDLRDHFAEKHLDNFHSYFCPRCKRKFHSPVVAHEHIRSTCKIEGFIPMAHYTQALLSYDVSYSKRMFWLEKQSIFKYGAACLKSNAKVTTCEIGTNTDPPTTNEISVQTVSIPLPKPAPKVKTYNMRTQTYNPILKEKGVNTNKKRTATAECQTIAKIRPLKPHHELCATAKEGKSPKQTMSAHSSADSGFKSNQESTGTITGQQSEVSNAHRETMAQDQNQEPIPSDPFSTSNDTKKDCSAASSTQGEVDHTEKRQDSELSPKRVKVEPVDEEPAAPPPKTTKSAGSEPQKEIKQEPLDEDDKAPVTQDNVKNGTDTSKTKTFIKREPESPTPPEENQAPPPSTSTSQITVEASESDDFDIMDLSDMEEVDCDDEPQSSNSIDDGPCFYQNPPLQINIPAPVPASECDIDANSESPSPRESKEKYKRHKPGCSKTQPIDIRSLSSAEREFEVVKQVVREPNYQRVITPNHVCEYAFCCDIHSNKKCLFCRGKHNSEDCSSYPTLAQRRAHLFLESICKRCGEQHRSQICPGVKCSFCHLRGHIGAICHHRQSELHLRRLAHLNFPRWLESIPELEELMESRTKKNVENRKSEGKKRPHMEEREEETEMRKKRRRSR